MSGNEKTIDLPGVIRVKKQPGLEKVHGKRNSSALEALSTFCRASRDPKGEDQLWVAKSTRWG